MNNGEFGQWYVNTNDDNSGVVLEFTEVGDDGVRKFYTSMPAVCAMALGKALCEKATDIA